jgi:hypothetical protein
MPIALTTAIIGGVSALGGGFTSLFKGSTQGTAECGARPLFIGKAREEWELCVSRQQQINYDLVLQEQKNKRLAILVIAFTGLIVTLIILKLKK